MKSKCVLKRCIGLVTVFAIVLCGFAGAFTISANAGEIRVTIDGQPVTFADQGPVIRDGRTLVPVRGVFEHLGFIVSWDGDARAAILTRSNDVIVITIDSATFTTNGTSYALDVPAQIINGSTMVPIRLPLESVGYGLDWDGANNTVVITSDGGTGASVAPPLETVRIVQDSFIVAVTSERGTPLQFTPDGQTGARLSLIYDISHWDGMMLYGGTNVEISNPDMLSLIGTGNHLNSRSIQFIIHQAGTATIDFRGQFASHEDGTQVTITAIHAPNHAIATANQDGVHLTSRMFLSQAEIQSMLPFARQHQDTMPYSRHPDRAMTDEEVQTWIETYNELGGINAYELEVLYLLNNIRAEHDLQPFSLCPRLSMAARLHTQLMREFDFIGHTDPFYGGAPSRAILFGEPMAWENARAGLPNPERTVDGWMNSPGHRRLILTPSALTLHVGIGLVENRATMKLS